MDCIRFAFHNPRSFTLGHGGTLTLDSSFLDTFDVDVDDDYAAVASESSSFNLWAKASASSTSSTLRVLPCSSRGHHGTIRTSRHAHLLTFCFFFEVFQFFFVSVIFFTFRPIGVGDPSLPVCGDVP